MKWLQYRYRGPLWLWALAVTALYALVVILIDDLNTGPAARVSIEEVAEAPHSPQQ